MSPQTQSVSISTAFSQTCVPTCTAIQGKHQIHILPDVVRTLQLRPSIYRTHPDPLK